MPECVSHVCVCMEGGGAGSVGGIDFEMCVLITHAKMVGKQKRNKKKKKKRKRKNRKKKGCSVDPRRKGGPPFWERGERPSGPGVRRRSCARSVLSVFNYLKYVQY